jgi:hypothetical protein
MAFKPYRVDLVVGDLELVTSYSDTPPFVPRKTDVICSGLDEFRVLEVKLTYLIPTGMNAVVYLEKI